MKEIVATGLGFPEGPVALPDGRLAFCEQVYSRISAYDGARVDPLVRTGGSPNGAALGSDGNLYVAQNGGVVGPWRAKEMISPSIQRVSLDGRVDELGTSLGGEAFEAPNDICFGPDGYLYFTDPAHAYDPGNRCADGRIYALGRGGSGRLAVRRPPVYPNGVGFTPDGRLLWVESYERDVYVMGEGGPERLCRLPENHLPDGFAVARDGRIFIATFLSHGITVIAPDGEYLGLIELDGDCLATNCAFQGNTLFVTDVRGFPNDMTGGRLWRVETDAEGMPLHSGAL